jgi:hypothetical protein
MNPYDYYITPEEFEQAERNGISRTTFYNRVRQLGWSKEKAMTTPPQKRKFHSNKWIKIAEKNGICYSTYKYRVNELGWEPERAATQQLQDRRSQAKRAHESARKYPLEIINLLKRNGINYDTFRSRIYAGWSMEKAATVKTMTPREIGLSTKEKRQISLKRIFLKEKV